MIKPDDPRHGLPTGYNAGCRESCCRVAKKIDHNWRLAMIAAGHEFTIPRDRTVRKLHALAAVGWSTDAIGAEMEISGSAVRAFLRLKRDDVFASVAARYDDAYRALEMRIPPDHPEARRLRTISTRKGWKPPLAWEDIDAGVLAKHEPGSPFFDRFDEDLIEYVMQYHDFTERINALEKSEIVRRWTANGRSEASLCALTGWCEGRYHEPRPEEAA